MARMVPKIGATIILGTLESRAPKKTKPTPGLCENGLPKLESAISASSIANVVSAAPRDWVGIADTYQARSALRRRRMIAVASGMPTPIMTGTRLAASGCVPWFLAANSAMFSITQSKKMYANCSA